MTTHQPQEWIFAPAAGFFWGVVFGAIIWIVIIGVIAMAVIYL